MKETSSDNAAGTSRQSKRRRFTLRPSLVIAVLLAGLAAAWILSGQIEGHAPPATANAPSAEGQAAETTRARSPGAVAEGKAVAVRVYDSVARPQRAVLQITGRTEAERRVTLSAETEGRVTAVNVDLGDVVDEGDALVELATDDRMAQLREAQALMKQREIEFNAADKLSKKGFQSETARAQARAQLEAAQAQLERIQVELAKTKIAAPFAGVIEAKNVEPGDFAQVGTALIHLVDLDPMLVTVQVSEREIDRIEKGAEAEIRLVSGRTVTGRVNRIAPTATETTRTFEVEVELPNPDFTLRDGVTASVRLPTREALAHELSPAVLTLDDAGRVGVKAVSADDRVTFHPVDILEDRADGMWVTGLPMTLTIISVGQEYVGVGAKVRPVPDDAFEDATEPRLEQDPADGGAPPRVSRSEDEAAAEQAR